MELTQYLMRLREDDDPMISHVTLRKSLSRKLLEFPTEMVPTSAVVHNLSPRAAFLRIFQKYIGDHAEWKVQLRNETRRLLGESYRRLNELKKSAYSDYVPPRRKAPIQNIPSSSEMTHSDELPPGKPVGMTGIGGDKHHYFNNVMRIIDDAADILMNDVVQSLESSFHKYRKTEVINFYVFFCCFSAVIMYLY